MVEGSNAEDLCQADSDLAEGLKQRLEDCPYLGSFRQDSASNVYCRRPGELATRQKHSAGAAGGEVHHSGRCLTWQASLSGSGISRAMAQALC